MIDLLENWDHGLLLLINKNWSNPLFDWLMPTITDLHHSWGFKFIFVPGLILFLIFKKKYWGALFLFILICSLAASDMLGGQILKPFFERNRPPLAGLDVILRAPHYGGYSFPSNHALNIFTAGSYLSFVFPRYKFVFFTYAFLVAYSRVYCGVHFPSDAVIGALIGSLIGFCFYRIFIFFEKKITLGAKNV